MPRYRFEALTYAGKSERGSVEGENVRAVRQALMDEVHLKIHYLFKKLAKNLSRIIKN